jgi:hypothetical protein
MNPPKPSSPMQHCRHNLGNSLSLVLAPSPDATLSCHLGTIYHSFKYVGHCWAMLIVTAPISVHKLARERHFRGTISCTLPGMALSVLLHSQPDIIRKSWARLIRVPCYQMFSALPRCPVPYTLSRSQRRMLLFMVCNRMNGTHRICISDSYRLPGH